MHNVFAWVIILLRFCNKVFHTFALKFTHMKTLQFDCNFLIRFVIVHTTQFQNMCYVWQ